MKRLILFVQVLVLAIVTIAFSWPSHTAALTNSQVTLGAGSQANLAISGFQATPDGRYIVFETDTSTVVSGDTNGTHDVFVRDTFNNTTTRVSVDSSGNEGNGYSSEPQITNNGKYVLFQSRATNLASLSGISNYYKGLYLHNMVTGATELVTYAATVPGNNYEIHAEDLSEDARFVYYRYVAPAGNWEVWVKDRLLNTTSEVSTSAAGTSGNGTDQATHASCDGRFSVFQSSSTNLVTGDTNGQWDIFLVDNMNTHAIKNITISGNDTSSNPDISCDGNNVTFASTATNLVAGDTNGRTDMFVYNVPTDTVERVSLGTSSTQLSSDITPGTISADGRYVTYGYYESNGVTPTSKSTELYVRDRQTNVSTRISENGSSQAADCDTHIYRIAYDGKSVLYGSCASNLGASNSGYDYLVFRATSY